MTDQQRGLLKDFWGPGMSAEPGERAVVPELAPAPSDWSLIWRRWRAFRQLICWRVCVRRGLATTLILFGVYAHVGVLDNGAGGVQPRHPAVLVADALGDFTEADHRHTPAYAALCCAMVVLTEDVLR